MNPFRLLRDYEDFVYTLAQAFPVIQRSTLVVVRRGKQTAVLQGELAFAEGYRLSVKERLALEQGVLVIESYGYEIWRSADKICWYDSQAASNRPGTDQHSSSPQAHFPRHQAAPRSGAHDELCAPQSVGLDWRN